jgi:glycerophosphoryl diester phosphodiesterase
MHQVEVVHSVGSAWQLSRIRRLAARGEVGSISINQRLLTAHVAQELVSRASRVWVWPVNSIADMRRLHEWGIGAMITDKPNLLGQAL